MKIYIAGRFLAWKDEMPRLKAELEARGHSLAYDWSAHPDCRPYAERQEEARAQVIADAEGVAAADAAIILADDARGGAGLYVELGLAIERHRCTGEPRIFVVGQDNAHSAFFFHPSVVRVGTFEEALDLL